MVIKADFLRGRIILLSNYLLNITAMLYVRTSFEIELGVKLQTDSFINQKFIVFASSDERRHYVELYE